MKQIFFHQEYVFGMFKDSVKIKRMYLIFLLFSEKQVEGNYISLLGIEQFGSRRKKQRVQDNFLRYISRDNLTSQEYISLNKFFLKEK